MLDEFSKGLAKLPFLKLGFSLLYINMTITIYSFLLR